jgi:hypothetical protein
MSEDNAFNWAVLIAWNFLQSLRSRPVFARYGSAQQLRESSGYSPDDYSSRAIRNVRDRAWTRGSATVGRRDPAS